MSGVFRRTKADACRPDGSTLFARRWVHTESFVMSEEERIFYNKLNEYLADGFALARRQGSKGNSLGFVMTIFQKIAASSFAAIHRTLRRRLLALTVQEGLMHDENLDIDQREAAFKEARELIRHEFRLGYDRLAEMKIDSIVSDVKRKVLKAVGQDELAVASDESSSESDTFGIENAATTAVKFALPEERARIKSLLTQFPSHTETKVRKLLEALGTLWRHDPSERVVVFATYLGSVEMLETEIERIYPGQGIVVLKGGDHGAKVAAERRFRRADGPKVLLTTAAGREGINLQFARILFNFDLPWNPMDVEQRIGRIHRYGQKHTAQVYNLVLSDTIEGKIFLLLNDKLRQIAQTLGKADEYGNVVEDFRAQILGQLSERLSYERLYSQAIGDPALKRTNKEIEAAMSNASEAGRVVSELFQDLDRFDLNDYRPLADISGSMNKIIEFVRAAAEQEGKTLVQEDSDVFAIVTPVGDREVTLTSDRQVSLEHDNLGLLGLDNEVVVKYVERYRSLDPSELGIRVRSNDEGSGVLSLWHVETNSSDGVTEAQVLALAVDGTGRRMPGWERKVDHLYNLRPYTGNTAPQEWLLREVLESMLVRELMHRGLVKETRDYTADMIGWVEIE